MSELKTALGEMLFGKRRKLPDKDFSFFLIEKIKQDIADALQRPEISKDCLESALDNIFSLEKDLRGE